MTNIKVWGRRNSVNVQKVMWAIGEMNLEFRRYDIGGSFGINDNYLKLNPSGTVPTIEDGDFILWESNSCVRYLAREYGMGDLYPEDSQKIGLALGAQAGGKRLIELMTEAGYRDCNVVFKNSTNMVIACKA